MRLGCGGCLTLLILGLLSAVGTSVWGTSQALKSPATLAPVRATAEDAARAQQKLFRVIRGSATEPVVVSEAELNAFVSRNVEPADIPFDQPTIFLRGGDTVEIVGHIPLGRLLGDSPLGAVAGVLPARWSTRPVWLQVGAHAQFEQRPRPQLRLELQRLAVGRQRLPVLMLRLLIEPARLHFLRVTVPPTVADIRVEPGRVLIRPTSSRERT